MKFAVLIAIIAFATSSYAGSVTYRTSHPYRRADRGMEDALGQVRSLGGLGGVSMPTLGLKRSDVDRWVMPDNKRSDDDDRWVMPDNKRSDDDDRWVMPDNKRSDDDEINRGFAPIGTPLDFAAPVGARQGVTAPRVVLLVAAPVVAHKSSDHAPVVSRAPARRQDIGGAYHAAPVDANQPVFLRSEINWNTYK